MSTQSPTLTTNSHSHLVNSIHTQRHCIHQSNFKPFKQSSPSKFTPSTILMTSYDVFCFITSLHMREAELEALKKTKEADKADRLLSPGDSAKGAKLFQVRIPDNAKALKNTANII